MGKLYNIPDDREEDGTAADQVHSDEDLLPHLIVRLTFLCFLNDDLGDVRQDLQNETKGKVKVKMKL